MSQITKRALASALKELLEHKPLNKITIADITEQCGVNRQTFYYHFQDIYALLEWIYTTDAQRLLEGKRDGDTWQQGFLQVLEYIRDNRALVRNTYPSVSRELLELVSQSFPERSGAMPVLLAFVLCLLSAMNDTTAPSVSLEGKQLWLAQSLPVSPWQVLRAKLRLQLLLITVPPMLLCLVCLLAVYPGSPLELLFIAVTALSYALLMALLGLFLGLKMPNLSWTNEVVPIKQSACVALSLFSGWAVAMIPGALYLLTGFGSLDPLLYLSVVTALVLILSAVLSLWVKKTGSRIFAAL